MAQEALERLKTLRQSQVLAIAGIHVAMIVSVIWGEFTYLMLHALLGIELVLVNLVSAAFYRRWRRHLLDMLRSAFFMAVLLLLLLAGWMLLTDGRDDALALAFAGMDSTAFAWAAAYVAIHLAITAVQAVLSPEPRFTWIRAVSVDGAASTLAAVAMVFLTFFAGFLLAGSIAPEYLASALAVATVVVRFPFALLAATLTDAEHREAAADPWAAMKR